MKLGKANCGGNYTFQVRSRSYICPVDERRKLCSVSCTSSSKRDTRLSSTMPHVTALSTGADSFFSATKRIPSDAIFALTAQYFKDPFPNKVNLGQGTYRDEHGQPWVLPSVKRARRILEEGGLNHEYLPILGLPDFRRFTSRAVLGRDAFQSLENRV